MFKNLKTCLSFLSITYLLVVITINTVSAKSYSIDAIKIHADIQSDGSLLIEDHRTYSFRGEFHWADYEIPLKKLGRVTDFSLTENEIPFREQQGSTPGTFQMRQSDDKFYVKWFYNARGERRTFTLQYRIADAVTVHNDIAELYFNFVGSYAEKSIGEVDVWVNLAQPADTAFVRAWAHGPLHGQLEFKRGKIHLWVHPLPRKHHWGARIIFPPDWVPTAQKRENADALQTILSEEEKLVAESNARRESLMKKEQFKKEHRDDAMSISIILSAIGLGLLFLLYQRYGKAFPVYARAKYSSDIPENMFPALANYVHYTGQIGAGAMVATLFDLARRGFLKIEEGQTETKSIFGTNVKTAYLIRLSKEHFEVNQNKLKAHESDLIDFLFNQLGAGNDEINFETIKKADRKFIEWFKEWKKIIKHEWGDKPFYEKQSEKGTVVSVIYSVFLIIAGIFGLIFLGEPGTIALISGIILLGLSFVIPRYTKEVKQMKSQLTALNTYLKQYHFKREAGDLSKNLEIFFIYGIALGAGTKFIKELLTSAPDWQHTAIFPWYIGAIAHSSPASFAGSVSAMVSSVSTTMGSAAGVGGGASAGGAGAAGGASGGAG